jgi:hypothetical protein
MGKVSQGDWQSRELSVRNMVRLSALGEEIVRGLQCGAIELEPGRDFPCFSDRMAVCNAMREYLKIHEEETHA